MKKNFLFLLFFAFSLAAQAATDGAKVDIDIHASTLGFGAGFAIPVTENIAGRLSLNKYNYAAQLTEGNIKYDAAVKLETIAALADWHVFSGITHLTAGLVYNNNRFDMTAAPVGNFIFNGVSYPATDAGTVSAAITFNNVAPYLGIGWSGRASKTGFSFKSDIGVLYQGSPKAKLSATGAASNAALAADLAAAESKLNADLAGFNILPVVSIGIGYAF